MLEKKIFKFEDCKKVLNKRNKDSHKGIFGKTLIIGGDSGMGGASILASETALISGAGIVFHLTKKSYRQASLKRNPEIMLISHQDIYKNKLLLAEKNFSSIVIGPGMSNSKWSIKLFDEILRFKDSRKNKTIIIFDAGALNYIADNENIVLNKSCIITPHPGEAARLLNTNVKKIQADRENVIKALVKKYNCYVILKGRKTLITGPNEKKVYECKNGGPELSTAGSGDVLCGVISALICQNMSVKDACLLGVSVHGKGGEIFKNRIGEIGLTSSELAKEIRRILN